MIIPADKEMVIYHLNELKYLILSDDFELLPELFKKTCIKALNKFTGKRQLDILHGFAIKFIVHTMENYIEGKKHFTTSEDKK